VISAVLSTHDLGLDLIRLLDVFLGVAIGAEVGHNAIAQFIRGELRPQGGFLRQLLGAVGRAVFESAEQGIGVGDRRGLGEVPGHLIGDHESVLADIDRPGAARDVFEVELERVEQASMLTRPAFFVSFVFFCSNSDARKALQIPIPFAEGGYGYSPVGRSVPFLDFDGERVIRAEHVRSEDHVFLVRGETGVGLESVIVLRHVDQFLGLEVATMNQVRADRAFAGHAVRTKKKDPGRVVVAVATEKFSIGGRVVVDRRLVGSIG